MSEKRYRRATSHRIVIALRMPARRYQLSTSRILAVRVWTKRCERGPTIVDAVRDACERVGFLVITGHGVPEDTIQRTRVNRTRARFSPARPTTSSASSVRVPASAAATTALPARALAGPWAMPRPRI